jgi:geranylgeranyl diphosphate synthase type II
LDFLAPYAALFEKQLQDLDFPSQPETLYRPQRYILRNGGKRIRPILSLISCGICGSEPEKAMPAALAVELLHNFTLIHDDIMDQADSRRGKPSVHKKWNEATAILSGDSMFTYSLLQLQKIAASVDHKKISDLFLKAINRVCEGQAMDMEFESRSDVTVEEYHQMIEGKTGALIGAAMQMGGMCGHADQDQLDKLSLIGHSLGLAFQIQDDWLDVYGDPDKVGKKKAGDIREGKKTLLMLGALKRCSDAERSVILGYIENKPLSVVEVDHVIEIFESQGIEADVKNSYLQHYSRAENALQEFGDSNYKQDLQHLINFLKNRES